ncbi:hypothetical protein V8D89_003430 [Ganoderma adspersum]
MLLALFTLLILPSTAASVNVTVDDTFGSKDGTVIPEYLPANSPWHVGSPTEQCDICAIKPSKLDTTQILNQTWHHGSYLREKPLYVQVTFSGAVVYIYNVVLNTLPGANTFMNTLFTIDGETAGQFLHAPDSSSEILYNHLVYANASLSADAPHTLVMSASGRNESFVFFDYLLYTTEIDAPAIPASATSSSTASPSSTLTTSTTSSSAHPQTAITITASATVFLGSTTPSAASSTTTLTSSPSQLQTTVTTVSAALDTVTVSAGSSTPSAASSSTRPQTGLIAGGVIAGIALLVMVPAIVFSVLRHQQRSCRAYPYGRPPDATSMDHWAEPMTTSSNLSLGPSVGWPLSLNAGVGALQGLQAEITALRSLVGTMETRRHTASCEEMLPEYYEDVDSESDRRQNQGKYIWKYVTRSMMADRDGTLT